ncbi:MAG: hypothetical protein ACRDPF_12700 [Streptosporangiaceae bacterium]
MAAETLLALWNDTPTRRAIGDFVQAVSTEGSPGFVVPAQRVAVFDDDGTLWSEKPVPIQLDFTLSTGRAGRPGPVPGGTAALPGVRVRPHGGAAALPGGERLQHLHRLGRGS